VDVIHQVRRDGHDGAARVNHDANAAKEGRSAHVLHL